MSVSNASTREREHLLAVYAQLNFEPIRGEGAWLIDAGDRRVLDLYGGHAVAALGYDNPSLGKALCDQWQTLPFQSNAIAMDIRAAAAEALVGFAPNHLTHAFFVNSGAEANENALRLAFMATGRRQVVAVKHAFHGRSAAAAAVTWGSRDRWYAFPELPFDVTFVERDDVDAARQCCSDQTAAVIVEPIQGVAGAHDLSLEFMQALAESADRSGAILIADEVQSGMGRSGRPFAFEHADIQPDIVTAAKSLGGGFPCGAVITSPAIADICKTGDLGTTFGGGPMAAAAIQSVVNTIVGDSLVDNAAAREAQIREHCVTGPVTAVQGRGLLIGLRTVGPARAVRDALLANNILTGTSADPEVLRLLPPLTIGESDIQRLVDVLGTIDPETTS